MTHPHTSRAVVGTDSPERYAKQLASHLGRNLTVTEEDAGTRIAFEAGDCLMTSDPGALVLSARAADEATLDTIEDVVGRHLEKFGARAELTVDWERSTSS